MEIPAADSVTDQTETEMSAVAPRAVVPPASASHLCDSLLVYRCSIELLCGKVT